jgi:hypothetical protein
MEKLTIKQLIEAVENSNDVEVDFQGDVSVYMNKASLEISETGKYKYTIIISTESGNAGSEVIFYTDVMHIEKDNNVINVYINFNNKEQVILFLI